MMLIHTPPPLKKKEKKIARKIHNIEVIRNIILNCVSQKKKIQRDATINFFTVFLVYELISFDMNF